MPLRALFVVVFVWTSLPHALGQTKANQSSSSVPQDYSKEAFVIEHISTRITYENDGSGVREVSAVVKVLADAGLKAFAILNFTYTSANEQVDVDYVRVRKPDGTVVKTPDYNIQDMPGEVTRTAPLYSDIHEKHVAVKGLSVGDTLEYLVRYRVVKPEVQGHFWQEYSFAKDAIAKDEKLEVDVPKEKYVKVVSPDFKPEIRDENLRRVYRWTHANLEVKEKDPDEAPRRIPPNPDVQITTFTSWEEVGNWYAGLQKDSLELTPSIQTKAAELTRGLSLNDEKIHSIYNFVSLKIHYVGLDFGIGRYQPHAAADVLDNGYGDCKDKHTLLAALLKAAGIETWPVLIHVQRKLDPEVPSPAQFNHVITVVPNANGFLWLDTTPEVAPYGLLLLLLRDKQVLAIPSNKPPLLMTTPQNPTFPQQQEFSVEGKLSADGTFSGHVEQSYRGDSEIILRGVFRQVAQSQWKEAVQRFSYGLNFGGDVSNVKMTPPDELDKPFELSYDYVRKNYSDWENRQITPPLPPMGVEIAKGTRSKKPSEPVLLGAVGKVIYRSRIDLPPGYTAVAPQKCHLTESFAEYSDDTQFENGTITTTRALAIKMTGVPLGEWEAFHQFGRALADDEDNYIRLSRMEAFIEPRIEAESDDKDADEKDIDHLFAKGTDALERREAKRAQELFERVIARDPNHHGAHFNLGMALMAQNRPIEALAEYHKEEEISPNDQRSFQAAAAVSNFTGDKDQAVSELRKLHKNDPENSTASAMLGELLVQNGKYSEAAEALESATKAAPDDPNLHYQLGEVYLKSGQIDKAVAHLQEAGKRAGSDPSLLNNVAYALADNKIGLDMARQYSEKAVEKVEAQSFKDATASDANIQVTYQLSMVWDTAGWSYFQSGDTSRSESFVRAAWLLGQEAVVGDHLGQIYEKEGKAKAAAQAYEFALAAINLGPLRVRQPSNFPVPAAPLFNLSERDALARQITARYERLTGKKPSINESRRLPNGEWTKTITEQLTQMRTIKLGKIGNLSGSAEFSIVFAPGKVESLDYVKGDRSVTALAEQLKSAHYGVEFPTGSQAKVVRRMEVNCSPVSGCMAVLVPLG